MKSLARLNKYLWKYRWHLAGGFLFLVLSNLFSVMPAQIVRHAFDLIAHNIEVYDAFAGLSMQPAWYDVFAQSILLYGILIVVMALLKGLFLFLVRQTIIRMSRLIEYDQKNEIYAHYQSLPLQFYRRNNTGDLMARISEDVSKVRMYTGPAMMYGLNLIILFSLVIGFMLSINPTLTFYVLLPLPVLSVSIYFVNHAVNKRSEEIQRALSGLSIFVQEAFSGIRVLKAFAREQDSGDRFLQKSNEYRAKSLKLTTIQAFFFPLILGLIGLSTILAVYVGGREVIAGEITTGNIAEFVIYINLMTWPVTSLGWVTSIIQRAAASQTRINQFLDVKTHLVSRKGLKKPIHGAIAFENVTFHYPDSGITALKNLSFRIEPGQTLAILGSTGSGKSTVADLLCRLFDPSQGRILIDGEDLRDYDVTYIRRQLGYVPQDVFLFSDTIGNNLKFGTEEEIPEEELSEMARRADLLETIEQFPQRYETPIGERGVTLSGGQKQRLAIARALVRDPKILILDDALSAVDTHTENVILSNLKEVMQERTSVIISHRISSAKLADYVLMLDDGYIVQEGQPDELLQQAGPYRDLYEKQNRKEGEAEQ